jgi:hypothetical protein
MAAKGEAQLPFQSGHVIDKKPKVGSFPEVPYWATYTNQIILDHILGVDFVNRGNVTILNQGFHSPVNRLGYLPGASGR